ncbi:NDR1/HIN1-like protein 1 [Punica granatum]|uniref:Uncharacterized protein n=2 Tax=Punica granatum TaxID=22663 RepID=A0A218XP60_PUNGR|nr:NDR1/HIN1-like protein 1 [Punica granatum]OWM86714.1 hypothetical protein CDL15_Pgr015750 [Punica granatum]PKI75656.1 hypothetical protein CRG98_003916 [Punica granatum]
MDSPDKDGETQTTKSNGVRKITCIVVALLLFPIFIFILKPDVRAFFIHPHKPQFTLQEITLYNLSVVSVDPSLVSSMFQTTISSRNPNSHFVMYYETVEASLTYHN